MRTGGLRPPSEGVYNVQSDFSRSFLNPVVNLADE